MPLRRIMISGTDRVSLASRDKRRILTTRTNLSIAVLIISVELPMIRNTRVIIHVSNTMRDSTDKSNTNQASLRQSIFLSKDKNLVTNSHVKYAQKRFSTI